MAQPLPPPPVLQKKLQTPADLEQAIQAILRYLEILRQQVQTKLP